MTFVAMMRTMTSEIHEVHSPITSTRRSMPPRRPRGGSCRSSSGTADLAVIDSFAVAGPGVVLGLEREVRIVNLLRDRILGDRFVEHFLGRRAQRLDHIVGQRPRDHTLL